MSWSLRLAIIRVSGPLRHALRDERVRQRADVGRALRSAARSDARRIVEASSRTDRRCSPKRSRSETTPATRPASSTATMWRMPRCAIASAASPAVALRGKRDHRRAGHAGDGGRERRLRQHDAPDHVLPREDAEGTPAASTIGQRTDPPLLHQRERLPERLVPADRDRLAAQDRRESRRAPPLLGHRRGVLGLELLPGEVDQVPHAARAEVLEDARAFQQPVEHGGRKDEHERVLQRDVAAGARTVRDQGTEREELALVVLPLHRRGSLLHGTLAADGALADVVAMRRPSGPRARGPSPRGEVTDDRGADHLVEVRVGHPGEGGMRLQGLAQAGDDRGGGSSHQLVRGIVARCRIVSGRASELLTGSTVPTHGRQRLPLPSLSGCPAPELPWPGVFEAPRHSP